MQINRKIKNISSKLKNFLYADSPKSYQLLLCKPDLKILYAYKKYIREKRTSFGFLGDFLRGFKWF